MSVFHNAGSEGYIRLSQESSYEESSKNVSLRGREAWTHVGLDDLVPAVFGEEPVFPNKPDTGTQIAATSDTHSQYPIVSYPTICFIMRMPVSQSRPEEVGVYPAATKAYALKRSG